MHALRVSLLEAVHMKKARSVSAYIAAAPPAVRARLKRLRQGIKRAAPQATERISYGIPFYEYGGTGNKGRLIYLAAFKQHIGVFIPPKPSRGYGRLERYRTAKSSFRFPLDKPFPFALLGARGVGAVHARDAGLDDARRHPAVAPAHARRPARLRRNELGSDQRDVEHDAGGVRAPGTRARHGEHGRERRHGDHRPGARGPHAGLSHR